MPIKSLLSPSVSSNATLALAAAGLLLATGLAVIAWPGMAREGDRYNRMPILPESLLGDDKVPLELSPGEAEAFTGEGAGASKARYGKVTLLVVTTPEPYLHLKAPDEGPWLRGREVEDVGVRVGGVPTAVYRSVGADGQVERVHITFVSKSGMAATSVAEAVWLWMAEGEGPWTALVRSAPWDEPEDGLLVFDAGMAQAFFGGVR